jgi:fumarate reductase subunit C
MNLRLYLLQRATALLMVPLIIGHLVIILHASAHGVAAADILARTRGSVGWAAYYGAFVLLASVHGAIGLRTIAAEWGGLRTSSLDAVMWGCGLAMLALGIRAVIAVVLPGSLL